MEFVFVLNVVASITTSAYHRFVGQLAVIAKQNEQTDKQTNETKQNKTKKQMRGTFKMCSIRNHLGQFRFRLN